MTRPTWDAYFLDVARVVSTRATCPRKSVGAVVVDVSNHIVGTGYNGAKSGAEQCDEVGCLIVKESCKRVVHAELNAISQAQARGSMRSVDWHYSTIYVTTSPCVECYSAIVRRGIARIVFPEWFYRDRDVIAMKALADGVELVGPQ